MDDENFISINVWLCGRSYRLRVRPEEESAVRKAVKVADDKITEMRHHYAGRDDQDFIAMTLVSYAADTALDAFADPLLRSELDKLAARIDAALKD